MSRAAFFVPGRLKRPSVLGVLGLLATIAMFGTWAAQAQVSTPAPLLTPAPAAGSADEPSTAPAASGGDPSRNAARSRMHECGHQWNLMKASGKAAGMTWKDYARGCLAKQ